MPFDEHFLQGSAALRYTYKIPKSFLGDRNPFAKYHTFFAFGGNTFGQKPHAQVATALQS